MDYEKKFEFAMKKLSDFKNYIEVENYRSFLLLLLNLRSNGPQSILSKLGLGGGKNRRIIIPFDEKKKIYFTKIVSSFSAFNQLMIYTRDPTEKEPTQLIHKDEPEILKNHLGNFELKNLIPKDLVILTPKVVDYTDITLKNNNRSGEFSSGIETLFVDLAEFIISQKLKYLFLLKGTESEPDLCFSLNLSIEPTFASPDQLQLFDIYIDEEKKLRDYNFIKMDNDKIEKKNLEMEFLKEIKDLSHSELYKSHHTIIIPISSLNKP